MKLLAQFICVLIPVPILVAEDVVEIAFPGDVDHLVFRAVERRENERLRLELREGLSPNTRSADGTTLLMYAALHGDSEGVQILLEAGADPNLRNDYGATALIFGAQDAAKVRQLLQYGADPNAKSDSGSTALNNAASSAEGTESVALLVESGAELSGSASEVVRACIAGNVESLKVLTKLSNASSVDLGFLDFCAGMAASTGNREVLSILRDWAGAGGLDVTKSPSGFGLAFALRRDNVEMAKHLAGEGFQLKDLLDLTYSDVEPDADILKTWIADGADINAKGFRGYTALDYARLRGHDRTAGILEAAGAESGWTPVRRSIPDRAIQLDDSNRKAIITGAVEKSLELMFKSSDRFLLNRKDCTSCHHQHLPAIAAKIANSRGIPIRRGSLDRMNRAFIVNNIGALKKIYQGAELNRAHSYGFRLWMWSAQGLPENPVTKGMAWWFARAQLPDGSWLPQNSRKPLEDGRCQATALGIRALASFHQPGREREYEERVRRASRWLEGAPAQKLTEEAFRLLGLAWAGADEAVLRQGVRDLVQKQKRDGGWSQIESMRSDAWATGLALMAANTAGLPTDDPVYVHGMEFLLRTQFDDGSWWVQSRANPVQPHFDSHFPFGWDQWISASGTAVASASLALALEPAESSALGFWMMDIFDEQLDDTSFTSANEQFEFDGDRTVSFENSVRPILEESCLDCHTGRRPKGNFRMTDRDSFMRGGQSGDSPVYLGHADESQLIRHVTDQIEDMEMPPLRKRGTYPKLPDEQVKILRIWIDEGAHWPESVTIGEE